MLASKLTPSALAIAFGVGCGGQAAAQSFLGDTVNASYFNPGNIQNAGNMAVAPAAIFTQFDAGRILTVSSNNVSFAFTDVFAFNNTSSNGPRVTDMTNAKIANVALDPASNANDFIANRISFTANYIQFDFAGLAIGAGQQVLLDVAFL